MGTPGGRRKLGLWPPAPPEPGTLVKLPGGAVVNTFDEGQGTPIVLVHGLPGSAYEWGRLPECLLGVGFRVVRYDRVGYGHSSRRAGGEEPTLANALELAELCSALALPDPVLLGFSYGGAIVQDLVTIRPGVARAAVLLAAVGPRHVTAPVPGPTQQRAIRWALSSGIGAAAVAKQLGEPMFDGDPPARWVDLNCALLALPGAVGTVLQEATRLAPDALRPEGVGVPTLVIHGTADRTVAFEVGMDLMTRVPGAEFCEILYACHMLPFTEAESVASVVGAFVGRLAPEATEGE